MSVGIEIWFRSGPDHDSLVEMLGDPDQYLEEMGPVRLAACPELGTPIESLGFSLFKGFETWGNREVLEKAKAKGLQGLCLVNFRRACDELLSPNDPLSAFWVDNPDVRRAEETADSAERMLRMIGEGHWAELQYFVTKIERWKLDGYYRGVPVSESEFTEVVVDELTKIAGHCRWFVANRKPPVLVSVAMI